MPQPSEQTKNDAARVRRALLGLTLCQDCGAERAIGAKECMACRRCTQCGSSGCRRESCAEDAGMESARFDAQIGRLNQIAGLALLARAVGPLPAEVLRGPPGEGAAA